MKLGIYNQHTSNQKRTKFYQNRTIIDSKFFRYSKKGRLKILIISNFNCPMTILNHGRHRSTGSFCYPYNHSSLTVYGFRFRYAQSLDNTIQFIPNSIFTSNCSCYFWSQRQIGQIRVKGDLLELKATYQSCNLLVLDVGYCQSQRRICLASLTLTSASNTNKLQL